MEKEEIKKKVSKWIEKSHASMIENLERVINEQPEIFEKADDLDIARCIMCALLKEESFQFAPINESVNHDELVENIYAKL